MANNEKKDESVLSKTHISIQKLPDGSCIKKITETKDGKTSVKEEKVDCDTAVENARGENRGEDKFKNENLSFDERMHEKLKEMKKSFSDGDKKDVETKSESYSDATNKMEKVTRESSSIEETKKTEKIPNGTKRVLKITRESFVEETKKSLDPGDSFTDELKEKVKILDESFDAEAKEKCSEDEMNQEKEGVSSAESSKDESDPKIGDKRFSANKEYKEDNVGKSMEIIQNEDGWLKKVITTVLKILFYPLYKLNVL